MKDSINKWGIVSGVVSLLLFLFIYLAEKLFQIHPINYIGVIACFCGGYFLHKLLKIYIYHDYSTVIKQRSFKRYIRDISVLSKTILLALGYKVLFNVYSSDNEAYKHLLYFIICFEVFYAIYQFKFSNKVNS